MSKHGTPQTKANSFLNTPQLLLLHMLDAIYIHTLLCICNVRCTASIHKQIPQWNSTVCFNFNWITQLQMIFFTAYKHVCRWFCSPGVCFCVFFLPTDRQTDTKLTNNSEQWTPTVNRKAIHTSEKNVMAVCPVGKETVTMFWSYIIQNQNSSCPSIRLPGNLSSSTQPQQQYMYK